MILHLLNTTVEHWRRVTSPDEAGGQQGTWSHLGNIPARLSQPTSVSERNEAQKDGSDVTHENVFLPADADVRHNDELRAAGLVLQVDAVYLPSVPIYLKVEAESRQPEVT